MHRQTKVNCSTRVAWRTWVCTAHGKIAVSSTFLDDYVEYRYGRRISAQSANDAAIVMHRR